MDPRRRLRDPARLYPAVAHRAVCRRALLGCGCTGNRSHLRRPGSLDAGLLYDAAERVRNLWGPQQAPGWSAADSIDGAVDTPSCVLAFEFVAEESAPSNLAGRAPPAGAATSGASPRLYRRQYRP